MDRQPGTLRPILAGSELVTTIIPQPMLHDARIETRSGVARLLGVDAKTLWRALGADEL